MSPRVALIAALDRHGVIGREGRLPWRLRADLAHFRRITLGKPIVMGRKTHESIGRALDQRLNIVLSRDPAYHAAGCVCVASTEAAIEAAGNADELMVIGGASVYEAFFPLARRLLLTRVAATVTGDVHFPVFAEDDWRLVERSSHPADAHNEFPFEFRTYHRRT